MVVTLDGGEVKAMEPVRDEPEPWIEDQLHFYNPADLGVRSFASSSLMSGGLSSLIRKAKKKSLFGGFNLLRKQRTKSSTAAPAPLADAKSVQRAPVEYSNDRYEH